MASESDNWENMKYQKEIEQVRENMKELGASEYSFDSEYSIQVDSDTHLLRFLKANDFDVMKATRALKKVLKGSKIFQIDNIVRDYIPPKILEKYEMCSFLGFDKDDIPIIYLDIGNHDAEGFCHSLSTVDLMIHIMFWGIKLRTYQRERNEEVGKCTDDNVVVILDFENFSVAQATSRYTLKEGEQLLKIVQEIAPGILKHFFIINAPIYFTAFFNLMKPFMWPELLEMCVICSPESFKEELLKYIDAAVLPKFLGGDRVDDNGDPRCSEYISFGCIVPKEEYCLNRPGLQLSDQGVTEILIPPWNHNDVSIYVEKPGSKIHLEFLTYEIISFSIFFRKVNISNENEVIGMGEDEELFGPIHVYSHLAPVDNVFHCSWTGIYVFKFDNTASWVESKYLVYRIQVLPPLAE